MRRFLIRFVLFVAVIGLVGAGSAVFGYFAHKWRIAPVYSLAERAEVRLRRDLGLKTDIEIAVERIETIFLNLKGRVHVMPDRDFNNGGAMTVWGDDLLVMHRTGIVMYLEPDQEAGLQISDLVLPDNGAAGYETLAAELYPGRPARADGLRYNDIEYIETETFRGLALSYTFVDVAQACYRTRISWLPLPEEIRTIRDLAPGAEDWDLMYDSEPCLPFNETGDLMLAYMAGGRIGFKAPDLIYLGSGEYHLDGIYRPDVGIQSDDTDYGKVIEVNMTTRTGRVYSKGHRNLQGMVVTREGAVWTTEHGMRGGDELNYIVDGENYGWPIVDMGTLYNGIPQDSPSGPGRHTDFRAPAYAWVPSAAVSSITQIDGFHDAWDGDLLVTSLKNRTLYRVRAHDDRVISMEPIEVGFRMRDVTQWGPDRIALWMDLNEVVVFEIEERVNRLDTLVAELVADGMPQARAEAAHDVLAGCNECHSYEADVHGAGPSLGGVVGRQVASTAFMGYSDALSQLGGVWDEARLAAYLHAPEEVAEGTLMTGFGLGDRDLAADVAAGLARIEYAPHLDD